jgi:hypothetical protein
MATLSRTVLHHTAILKTSTEVFLFWYGNQMKTESIYKAGGIIILKRTGRLMKK